MKRTILTVCTAAAALACTPAPADAASTLCVGGAGLWTAPLARPIRPVGPTEVDASVGTSAPTRLASGCSLTTMPCAAVATCGSSVRFGAAKAVGTGSAKDNARARCSANANPTSWRGLA